MPAQPVDATVTALCAEIVAQRDGATCDVLPRVPGLTDRDAADYIAVHCEFTMLGDGWREVDRTAALAISEAILSRDLAYSAMMMKPEDARAYADRFIGLFDDARYYTNGSFGWEHGQGRQSAGWTPITPSTFDTGVIVVSELRIGILWVQDED